MTSSQRNRLEAAIGVISQVLHELDHPAYKTGSHLTKSDWDAALAADAHLVCDTCGSAWEGRALDDFCNRNPWPGFVTVKCKGRWRIEPERPIVCACRADDGKVRMSETEIDECAAYEAWNTFHLPAGVPDEPLAEIGEVS